jgi:TetR/AcrR family transcriptional regulator, regulator of biofilm formation and stress response
MTAPDGRRARGDRRRADLVAAAAALVREHGPGAVSHRAVAARAGASLSATTYYFTDLDELVAAAGSALADDWAAHARASVRAKVAPAAALVDAVLPPGDDAAVRGHYEHLVGAGRVPALATAYAAGRADLDAAIAELGLRWPAEALVALVDGAAVAALSEGRPVRAHVRGVVERAL